MSNIAKKIKEGLEDILAHKHGKLELHTVDFEIPEPPKAYKAKDIKQIRESRHYSQRAFALILNVSPRTVQSWESGRRNPTQSALRLLEIIDKDIYCPKTNKLS